MAEDVGGLQREQRLTSSHNVQHYTPAISACAHKQTRTDPALHGHQSGQGGGVKEMRDKNAGQCTSSTLWSVPCSSLLLLLTHTRGPACTFLPASLRPGSGGFEAILRLLFYGWFPSNMKRLPFPPNHTRTHAPPLGCHSGHTQTARNKCLASALPSHVRSCTHADAHARTHALILIFTERCTLHLAPPLRSS